MDLKELEEGHFLNTTAYEPACPLVVQCHEQTRKVGSNTENAEFTVKLKLAWRQE